MIFSVASGYRSRKSTLIIERVIYMYIYIYIERETYVELLVSHFSDVSRCISTFCKVGDNRRNCPHNSDQLGTENAGKTVMLIYRHDINVYRHEHQFGSFYLSTTIQQFQRRLRLPERNGSTRENLSFYWNTMTGNNSSTDVPLLR